MKMLRSVLQYFNKRPQIKMCQMCSPLPTFCFLSVMAKKLSTRSGMPANLGTMMVKKVITEKQPGLQIHVVAFHTDDLGTKEAQGTLLTDDQVTKSTQVSNVEEKPSHIPVMVETVLDILEPQDNQLIVDMTFGSGGHTRQILKAAPGVEMICLDRDPLAFSEAQKLAKLHRPGQITPFNGKFTDLPQFLYCHGIMPDSVDGFLFDVGASSMQLDEGGRGFSLGKDGPLDMRMDQTRIPNQPSAMDVVNNMDARDLAEIIRKYGEDRRYKQIAHAIVEARYAFGKISTTKQLAAIVESIYPEGPFMHDKLGRKAHVATRTFQALRIFVNNELNEINIGLHIANRYLKEGGVCVAITFHSLEDRIVKRHFHGIDMTEEKCVTIQQRVRRARGVDHFEKEDIEELMNQIWKPVKRGVITPKEEECLENPRSRSAKLRAAFKISSEQ